MKNLIKKTVAITCVLVLTTGCAIKQEDSTATKALKHTANAPAYVIVGVGMAATLAVQGTLIGAGKLVGAGKKEDTSTEVTQDSQNQENKNESSIESPTKN